MPATGEEEYSK